jgi:hypothetical protein
LQKKILVAAGLIFADFGAFFEGVFEKPCAKRWFLRGNYVVISVQIVVVNWPYLRVEKYANF